MATTRAQRAAKHGDNAVLPAQSAAKPGPTPYAGTPGNGNPMLIVIAGAVASAFLFWYFHLLVLSQMTQLSNGLSMPDSLVGGFSQGYVGQLRHVMNAAARGQLQFVHMTAGTLFPVVFALTWLMLIGFKVANKGLRRALWAVPVLFALVQISANIAIDNMLGGKTLSSGMVSLSSTLVVSSWILLVVSLAVGGFALFTGRQKSEESFRQDAAGEQGGAQNPVR